MAHRRMLTCLRQGASVASPPLSWSRRTEISLPEGHSLPPPSDGVLDGDEEKEKEQTQVQWSDLALEQFSKTLDTTK